jgi:hypothetical protein
MESHRCTKHSGEGVLLLTRDPKKDFYVPLSRSNLQLPTSNLENLPQRVLHRTLDGILLSR